MVASFENASTSSMSIIEVIFLTKRFNFIVTLYSSFLLLLSKIISSLAINGLVLFCTQVQRASVHGESSFVCGRCKGSLSWSRLEVSEFSFLMTQWAASVAFFALNLGLGLG